MQLPSHEEIILVSGLPPIRAQKVSYFSDKNFIGRVISPPALSGPDHPYTGCPPSRPDDWGHETRDVAELLSQPWFDQVGGADDGGKELAPKLEPERQAQDKGPAEDKELSAEGDDVAVQSQRVQDLKRASDTARRVYGLETGASKRRVLDF